MGEIQSNASNKLKKMCSSYEMAVKPAVSAQYVQKSTENHRQFDEFTGYTNKGYNGNNLKVVSDDSSDEFSDYSDLNNVRKQNYSNQ